VIDDEVEANVGVEEDSPERWYEGDGPVWPVTESLALFPSERLLSEILASREKKRPCVDLLLGGPSACVS